jgi:hypothetical protein
MNELVLTMSDDEIETLIVILKAQGASYIRSIIKAGSTSKNKVVEALEFGAGYASWRDYLYATADGVEPDLEGLDFIQALLALETRYLPHAAREPRRKLVKTLTPRLEALRFALCMPLRGLGAPLARA